VSSGTHRRIEALQRLADNPGTEAEGVLAKSFLEALSGKYNIRPVEQFTSTAALQAKFPRGSRVYYSNWCFKPNTPGVVKGYPKTGGNWIRIKFDHLKSVQAVKVYGKLGSHLSLEPVSLDRAYELIYIHTPNWRETLLETLEFVGIENIPPERKAAIIAEFREIPGMEALLAALGHVEISGDLVAVTS
jgi:hypothetical protein